MKFDFVNWIQSLILCSAMISVLLFLCPDDPKKRILETGCSCVMFLVFLFPIMQLRYEDINSVFSEYVTQIESENEELLQNNDEIYRLIIKEKYKEYITNEAKILQIDFEDVSVDVVPDEHGNYIPFEITYVSTEPVPFSFIEYIAKQLGVPKERQILQ